LLAASKFQGCATTLTDKELYEEKARHAERMDEIRAFITACGGARLKAVYYGSITNKLLNPFKQIPRHAHLPDYACASEQDIDRTLRESGLSM